MGQAINYALGNEQALRRYCEDGRLAIDNNAAERALRGVAIGRKNWMFAGSPRGGRTASIIFSLLAGGKRHDLDPWKYLRDVLIRLADLNPGELENAPARSLDGEGFGLLILSLQDLYCIALTPHRRTFFLSTMQFLERLRCARTCYAFP